ncbi:response regulator [Halodesulfovibrio sp.]|jgi:DNA-binding response OmpR family regulator|uniref:response regulator n=1 Tax=Halodesulfovibrio sp. TaxID=1912772 RepID=UPI0025FBEDD6|nr:response regulator [Halodesulfovibrio sp.]MCT4536224.1 response regulator [Halodesulfovibrio sp.]MCT4626868.1 response regulator [Halodesulfovibrio sp.]
MAEIMVLDDVIDAGILIKRILERKGHSVTVFTDEEEALNFARTHTPNLAILDIKLRKMTGVEVLAELRSYSPTTQVIMLTGYPTLETARESLKLGANEYCVKPIDKEELENKVHEVLSAAI